MRSTMSRADDCFFIQNTLIRGADAGISKSASKTKATTANKSNDRRYRKSEPLWHFFKAALFILNPNLTTLVFNSFFHCFKEILKGNP